MNESNSPCANVVMTSALSSCLSKAKISSEAKLKALYTELTNRLDKDEAERLTEVERLWERYRDANCKAEYDLYGGGTGGPPANLGCLEAMARARTEELRIIYSVRLKN